MVQIHGGPASATTTAFAGSYGRYDHVYAANGYALSRVEEVVTGTRTAEDAYDEYLAESGKQ